MVGLDLGQWKTCRISFDNNPNGRFQTSSIKLERKENILKKAGQSCGTNGKDYPVVNCGDFEGIGKVEDSQGRRRTDERVSGKHETR